MERANKTLQDRLVKTMRLEGINGMHTANAWIEPYIDAHNRRFAVQAAEPEDAHVPWRDDMDKLNVLLGHYEQRSLSKTLSCQFHKRILQIHAPAQQRRLAGQTVQIIEPLDRTLIVMHGKQTLVYAPLRKRTQSSPCSMPKRLLPTPGICHKPADNHSWTQWIGPTPNPFSAPPPAA